MSERQTRPTVFRRVLVQCITIMLAECCIGIGMASTSIEDEGVKLTAVKHEPAFVTPFKPIEGPTVWYGGDISVEASCTSVASHFVKSYTVFEQKFYVANFRRKKLAEEGFLPHCMGSPLGVAVSSYSRLRLICRKAIFMIRSAGDKGSQKPYF